MAKDDYDEAAKKLGAVADALHEVTDAQLEELGSFALSLIVARTNSGLDADGSPFVPYSDAYKEWKASKGRDASHVDLAFTGHMLGAMITERGDGDVFIVFASPHEAKKAAAHDSGVTSQASVRAHSRKTWVNYKGQRASAVEIKRDKRRKKAKRRLFYREEKVSGHKRAMRTPQRNFFDIRSDRDLVAVGEVCGEAVMSNVTKAFNK